MKRKTKSLMKKNAINSIIRTGFREPVLMLLRNSTTKYPINKYQVFSRTERNRKRKNEISV
jgi:hypothetical protein